MGNNNALTAEELFAQMEADEREDRLEHQLKASPIEYARSRAIRPQQVYYWIRSGKLRKEQCICGRTVIDIKSADAILQPGGPALESKVEEEEEA